MLNSLYFPYVSAIECCQTLFSVVALVYVGSKSGATPLSIDVVQPLDPKKLTTLGERRLNGERMQV